MRQPGKVTRGGSLNVAVRIIILRKKIHSVRLQPIQAIARAGIGYDGNEVVRHPVQRVANVPRVGTNVRHASKTVLKLRGYSNCARANEFGKMAKGIKHGLEGERVRSGVNDDGRIAKVVGVIGAALRVQYLHARK